MVIIQVSHRFLPEHVGGIETYTLGLSRHLAKTHQVQIFTCTHDLENHNVGSQDTVVQGLPVRKTPCRCQQVHPRTLAPFRNPSVLAAFENLLDEMDPQIVHIQHSDDLPVNLLSACRSRQVPVVVTLHDYTFACPTEYLIDFDGRVCQRVPGSICLKCVLPKPFNTPDRGALRQAGQGIARLVYHLPPTLIGNRKSYTLAQIRALRYRIENLKRVFPLAHGIIAPSRTLAERARALGVPREKLSVIPNGAEVGEVQHEEPGERIRFAFVGRVVPIKGAHVLVEAFKALEPGRARLHIYGAEGPTYGPALKASAEGREDIFFHGRFQPGEIFEILAQVDVLVVPSVCVENMPLVAMEALAAGIPVIASEVGGLKEVLRHDQNGYLFPMADHGALASILGMLVDHPGKIQELGKGIGPVMTVEENACRVEAVYRSVLSS